MVEFTLIKHSVPLQAVSGVAEQSNLCMTLASEGVAGEAEIWIVPDIAFSVSSDLQHLLSSFYSFFVTVSSTAWHQPLQCCEFEFQNR